MLDSVSLMQNVCALGPQNVGLVQNPVFHAGTTMQALVKHSRRLEDALMKSELDITQRVTLLFQKEAARQGSDKRPLTQVAVSPVASKACKWSDCEVHQTGLVGPLPLVRVSDMEGYDPENGLRPGAGARVERTLDCFECHFCHIIFGSQVQQPSQKSHGWQCPEPPILKGQRAFGRQKNN